MTDEAAKLAEKTEYGISDLLEIMKLLRSEDGCPWDREQTHKSIRRDFLEEAYEACEAIDLDNRKLLEEELGDVLLQVVFHSRIAEEQGDFDFSDVCCGICRKLIVRHPHVFGEVKVENSDEVVTNWEAIKNRTKSRDTAEKELDEVCKALPALMYGAKLNKKALKHSLPSALTDDPLKDVPDSEFEDVLGLELLKYAESARRRGLDAEEILKNYCKKRFFVQ